MQLHAAGAREVHVRRDGIRSHRPTPVEPGSGQVCVTLGGAPAPGGSRTPLASEPSHRPAAGARESGAGKPCRVNLVKRKNPPVAHAAHSPRIQIENPQPLIDCGRYRAKACVGDVVSVSATVFRDGHDLLRAVRYRGPSSRRWSEAPMRHADRRRR